MARNSYLPTAKVEGRIKKWKVLEAARELGISRQTMLTKLLANGCHSGAPISTLDLFRAMYPDDRLARSRHLTAKASEAELKAALQRGEVIPLKQVNEREELVFGAVRSRILNLENLSNVEKDEILAGLEREVKKKKN